MLLSRAPQRQTAEGFPTLLLQQAGSTTESQCFTEASAPEAVYRAFFFNTPSISQKREASVKLAARTSSPAARSLSVWSPGIA